MVRPVVPISALPSVVVVHRRTCWEIRHEVLASPGLILPDWASDLCYLQERILSNSTGQRVWTQNSWSGFRWMRPQPFLSIGLSVLCTYLFLLHDHCIGFPWGFLGIQWWSQHLFVTLNLRDQKLQCFPRNRWNASAIESRTSSLIF